MDTRSACLLQILEKIGAPITGAVGLGRDAGPAQAEQAVLLLRSVVDAGLALSRYVEDQDAPGNNDAVRVAATAIAGPLFSHFYMATGRVPEDAEIQAFLTGFDRVAEIAGTFSLSDETRDRLELAGGEWPLTDAAQIRAMMMGALAPLVNVVAAFSFGVDQAALLSETSRMLLDQARILARDIFTGSLREDETGWAEFCLLRTLVTVYCACHQEEAARLTGLAETERVFSPSAVRAVFEARLDMIRILGESVVEGLNGHAAIAGGQGGLSPKLEAVPVEPAQSATQPQAAATLSGTETAAAVQAAPAAPPPAEAPVEGPVNPMSFFKSGKNAG